MFYAYQNGPYTVCCNTVPTRLRGPLFATKRFTPHCCAHYDIFCFFENPPNGIAFVHRPSAYTVPRTPKGRAFIPRLHMYARFPVRHDVLYHNLFVFPFLYYFKSPHEVCDRFDSITEPKTVIKRFVFSLYLSIDIPR